MTQNTGTRRFWNLKLWQKLPPFGEHSVAWTDQMYPCANCQTRALQLAANLLRLRAWVTRSQDAVSDGSPAQTAVQSKDGWVGCHWGSMPSSCTSTKPFQWKTERCGKLAPRTLIDDCTRPWNWLSGGTDGRYGWQETDKNHFFLTGWREVCYLTERNLKPFRKFNKALSMSSGQKVSVPPDSLLNPKWFCRPLGKNTLLQP